MVSILAEGGQPVKLNGKQEREALEQDQHLLLPAREQCGPSYIGGNHGL